MARRAFQRGITGEKFVGAFSRQHGLDLAPCKSGRKQRRNCTSHEIDIGTLKIGGFAKARITLSETRALAIVSSAVMYDAVGAYVLTVSDGRTRQQHVKLGISAGPLVEVQHGLEQGDVVVARAGTFLRDGDAVRTVPLQMKSTVHLGTRDQAASHTTTGAIQ